ncbi:MAG: hypothetical protein CME67_02445 [Halobacteriovoraceae bacterium]|nr:hypothetical protein [Halobacteriovoraceae bacterium]
MKLLIKVIVTCMFLVSCNERMPKRAVKDSVVPSSENFAPAGEITARLIHGQSVYVPIYSSIYNRFEGDLLHLTAILSIRNTSPKESIVISQIDYYDTNGKRIKSFIDRPFSLSKMSSKDFVIPESDLSGGTGANFIVKWETQNKISAPVIEAVMIGSIGTKAFSFTSRGKEIEAH